MPSSEFRQISANTGKRSSDRLFKAAVSAYCAITRPSRNDGILLEDLVIPLFEETSEDTRRYASAALSETYLVPRELALLLCQEKAEICAPLLISAKCFSEGDLVTLLAKHGLPHARIISRRKLLHPVVRDLLFALGDETIDRILTGSDTAVETPKAKDADRKTRGSRSEAVRSKLRQIMREAETDEATLAEKAANDDIRRISNKMRSTAFSDNPAFFQTALADALGLNFALARSITEDENWERLAIALRVIGLPDAEAFMHVVAAYPAHFKNPPAVGWFIERYNAIDREAARDALLGWKAGAFRDLMAQKSGHLSEQGKSPATKSDVTPSTDDIRRAS